MKRVFVAAVFVLVGVASSAQASWGAELGGQPDCTFDGVAATHGNAGAQPQLVAGGQTSSLWRLREQGYSMYLRFYADGTVIGVSSTGTPAQIRNWFKAPYDDTGRYLVRGRRVRFSLTSRVGRVDYDGLIGAARLQLLSCSRINDKRSTDFYDRISDR